MISTELKKQLEKCPAITEGGMQTIQMTTSLYTALLQLLEQREAEVSDEEAFNNWYFKEPIESKTFAQAWHDASNHIRTTVVADLKKKLDLQIEVNRFQIENHMFYPKGDIDFQMEELKKLGVDTENQFWWQAINGGLFMANRYKTQVADLQKQLAEKEGSLKEMAELLKCVASGILMEEDAKKLLTKYNQPNKAE